MIQGCLPYPDTRGVNWANIKVNYGKLINFPPCGYHLPPNFVDFGRLEQPWTCRLIWINPMDHHGFWGPVNNTFRGMDSTMWESHIYKPIIQCAIWGWFESQGMLYDLYGIGFSPLITINYYLTIVYGWHSNSSSY